MHDINVEEGDILAKHKKLATKNANKLARYDVRAINVMGAIGSGKTALIEAINEEIKEKVQLGAVAGDVAGTDDYDRFEKAGITSFNLNTNSDCHLDAHLVEHSLENLPLDALDLVFVENVGNLVCPADFPLGTDTDLVVISVTEGEDMVRKHPKIFSQSNLVVVNKVDLADAIGVDPEKPEEDYHQLNPTGKVIFTAATRGQGIEELISALNILDN
ncbi:MAG: hydrogenase nickel incorporation protein HypB [Candidatus Bipolaricaulia bacterium]